MINNYPFRILLILAVSVLLSVSFPGNSTAQNTTGQTAKFVRIDIGYGGLHCPFLGPQLEKKLLEMGDVSNLKVFKQESYATFELPSSKPVSDADIKQVAVKVGYPEADVVVVISDSLPSNQQ